MFDITLIHMGKLKEKFNISAAEEYKKRSDEVIKDLNLRILAEQKKAERANIEAQTMDMNEKLNFYKQKKKFEKDKELIEGIDDIETIIAKANTMDILNEGIKNYPDKKKAKEVFMGMSEIINYEKQRQQQIQTEKKDNI